MGKVKARERAEKHWNFIEKLLRVEGFSNEEIAKRKLYYIEAMVHGEKHGIERIKIHQLIKEKNKR